MDDLHHARQFTYTAEAATWTFWCISTVLFGLKTFSRFYFDFATDAREDVIIAASWALSLCRQSFYQQGLTSIREIHSYDVERGIPRAAFWVLFSDYWFYLSSSPPKLAIALVLIRIFQPRKRTRVTMVLGCLLFGIYGIVGFFIDMFYCSPPAAQWDPYQYPNAHCWSLDVTTAYTAVFAISGGLIDFAFAFYPVILIWNLKLPIWKRVNTAAAMSVGIISGVLCMIKLIWLFPVHGDLSIYEKLYYASILGLFCAIENDLMVSAACLPFAAAVFRAWKPHIKRPSGWVSSKVHPSKGSPTNPQGDTPMTGS